MRASPAVKPNLKALDLQYLLPDSLRKASFLCKRIMGCTGQNIKDDAFGIPVFPRYSCGNDAL